MKRSVRQKASRPRRYTDHVHLHPGARSPVPEHLGADTSTATPPPQLPKGARKMSKAKPSRVGPPPSKKQRLVSMPPEAPSQPLVGRLSTSLNRGTGSNSSNTTVRTNTQRSMPTATITSGEYERTFNYESRADPSSLSDCESESSSADDSNSDDEATHYTPATAHTMDLVGGNGVQFHAPLSTSLPSLVPLSLQKKIWKHKFVDLAQLLPNDPTFSPAASNFAVQLDRNSNLTIVPKQKTRKITTIENWTSAFIRFVSIYSSRFPSETPMLMKYMEIVRDLAAKRPGLAFAHYDCQFRMLRESVQFPWDRIHMEYWLLATTEAVSQQVPFRASKGPSFKRPRFQAKQQRARFLPYTCWTYNRQSECHKHNCPHPHVCGLCRGSHPAAKCPASRDSIPTANARPNNTPSFTGPNPRTNKK